MNKNKKNILKISIKLIIIILLLILAIFSIKLSEKLCIDSNVKYYINLSELLCQIVIPTAFCVVSIIAITISIQNEKIYGITRKRFNKFRNELYFSLNEIVVSAIILSSFAIINYIMGIYISCIYYLCILVLICFSACCLEIPLMCHNDERIFKIIKRKIINDVINEEEFSSDLKIIIVNIIAVEHNLKYLYKKVELKNNKELNKKIFLRLLELQSDYALKLSSSTDINIKLVADRMVDNVKDIFSFKTDYNVFEITQSEILNYQFLITRVLFNTSKIDSSKRKTFRTLFDALPYIDNYKKNNQNKLLLSIIIVLVSYSLTIGNFEYCNYLKQICSKYRFYLEKDKALTTVFAITSIHLYYLGRYARNVNVEVKENINKFINDQIIIDEYITFSWSALYKIFLRSFKLNFEEFMYCFKLNEHNWDIKLYDSRVHSIIMDESFAVNWFFSNLFCSYASFTFDYNTLLKCENNYTRLIRNIGDSILSTSEIKNELLIPIEFYLPNYNSIFFEVKKVNDAFSHFINSIHIYDLERFFDKSEGKTNIQLQDEYLKILETLLINEYGYDKEFESNNKYVLYFNVIIEKKSLVSNYTEVMGQMIFSKICEEISSKINKNIVFFSKLNSLSNFFIKEKNIHVSQFIDYDINEFLSSSNMQDKVKILIFNSSILNAFYFTGASKLKFNFAMKIEIIDLTENQIIQKIQTYKTNDGRYLFEGTFLSYETLKKYIMEQFAYLKVYVEFIVNNKDLVVYEIEYNDTNDNV